MRSFIEESESKGELSLVTTWAQSLSESRDNFYNHYTMPFDVNNVDLTVSVNVLYGLTAAVLSDMQDPNSWFDDEAQMIYLNTTSLVMYEISNNFSSRPDLALTYYPSVFNFYWFTSRILNLLNSHDQLPYPVMQTVKRRMSSTMRGAGTNDILRRATRHNDFIYFDDFLGDNDKNFYGMSFIACSKVSMYLYFFISFQVNVLIVETTVFLQQLWLSMLCFISGLMLVVCCFLTLLDQ